MRVGFLLMTTILAASTALCQEKAVMSAQSMVEEARQASTLSGALAVAGTEPVRILYIHGIGATGSGGSLDLQRSICRYARKMMHQECVGGPTRVGDREYADDGIFAPYEEAGSNGLDPKVAAVRYMGSPIWTTWDQWHASAPFVDHYRILFRSGKSVLVDEINWWPLVIPIKCQFMMPDETQLAGRWKVRGDNYLSICSRQEAGVTDVQARSFNWLQAAGYTLDELNERPNRAVLINRWAKVGVMDWRFSDAFLGVGPLRRFISDGIADLLVKCIPASADRTTHFIAVTHSMGSYLLTSTLAMQKWEDLGVANTMMQDRFDRLLQHLDAAFFFANQIPLLVMADLDRSSTEFFAFGEWSRQRKAYLKASDGETVGRVVAWSDPDDVLTWRLDKDFQRWQTPPGNGIKVENRLVRNGVRWFGLVENPESAHDNYARNSKVLRALLESPLP